MRWNLSPKQNLETVTHLAQALGIDPLLSSLLVQRGIPPSIKPSVFLDLV